MSRTRNDGYGNQPLREGAEDRRPEAYLPTQQVGPKESYLAKREAPAWLMKAAMMMAYTTM
jgi:hypothetical protein